jgi:hypothetical protein
VIVLTVVANLVSNFLISFNSFNLQKCGDWTHDFMICAPCHQAGHYKLRRDLGRKQTSESHSLSGNGIVHSQFSLRLRFWAKEDLKRMLANVE